MSRTEMQIARDGDEEVAKTVDDAADAAEYVKDYRPELYAENLEFSTYAAEIAADAAKYAQTAFDFAKYAEKNAAAAEHPTQPAAECAADYALNAAHTAEAAAKFAQSAADSAAKCAAAYAAKPRMPCATLRISPKKRNEPSI